MEILSLALQGRLTAVDSRRWWKGKKKIDFIQLYYLYALAQTETVAVIQSNCDFLSACGTYTAEPGSRSGCIQAAATLRDGWLGGSSVTLLAELKRNEKSEHVGHKNDISDCESE